jgi:hypothetical protein
MKIGLFRNSRAGRKRAHFQAPATQVVVLQRLNILFGRAHSRARYEVLACEDVRGFSGSLWN